MSEFVALSPEECNFQNDSDFFLRNQYYHILNLQQYIAQLQEQITNYTIQTEDGECFTIDQFIDQVNQSNRMNLALQQKLQDLEKSHESDKIKLENLEKLQKEKSELEIQLQALDEQFRCLKFNNSELAQKTERFIAENQKLDEEIRILKEKSEILERIPKTKLESLTSSIIAVTTEIQCKQFPPSLVQNLPSYFKCKLTGHIALDPVVCPHGLTFSRVAITSWLMRNTTHPIFTKETLTLKDLRPNIHLKEALDDWIATQTKSCSSEEHVNEPIIAPVCDSKNHNIKGEARIFLDPHWTWDSKNQYFNFLDFKEFPKAHYLWTSTFDDKILVDVLNTAHINGGIFNVMRAFGLEINTLNAAPVIGYFNRLEHVLQSLFGQLVNYSLSLNSVLDHRNGLIFVTKIPPLKPNEPDSRILTHIDAAVDLIFEQARPYITFKEIKTRFTNEIKLLKQSGHETMLNEKNNILLKLNLHLNTLEDLIIQAKKKMKSQCVHITKDKDGKILKTEFQNGHLTLIGTDQPIFLQIVFSGQIVPFKSLKSRNRKN